MLYDLGHVVSFEMYNCAGVRPIEVILKPLVRTGWMAPEVPGPTTTINHNVRKIEDAGMWTEIRSASGAGGVALSREWAIVVEIQFPWLILIEKRDRDSFPSLHIRR